MRNAIADRDRVARAVIRRAGLAAGVLLGLMAPGIAAAANFACPRSLRTAQEAAEVPAGMVAEDGQHDWSRLAYVEFYAGSPVPTGPGLNPTRYALAPASHAGQGRTATAVWDFTGPADEAIWLGCHYHDTRIRLLLKLPATVARCTVTSVVLSIECE